MGKKYDLSTRYNKYVYINIYCVIISDMNKALVRLSTVM